MTAPNNDQFVDIASRSQEAVFTAVRTWVDNVQGFAGTLAADQSQRPDVSSVVEHYFDFAEKVLANQRQLATQFVSASVKAGESVQEQVSKVAEQVTSQTVNGTDAAATKVTEGAEGVAAKAATTARAARNVTKS